MWSSIENDHSGEIKQEKFVPSVIVGGGIRLGGISMMLKYDLVQDDYSPYGNNYQILIAGSCFAIIPILILFFCFQRYFIEGMTAGGVKG